MATDPIAPDFERPDILDYQLPLAVGATIAGATAMLQHQPQLRLVNQEQLVLRSQKD